MKTSITFLAFFLNIFLLHLNAFAQTSPNSGDQIIGMYWSPSKDAKIEVYKKGGQYFGKSVWVANNRKDNKNPDDALKTRDILGIELLTNFTYEDGPYIDGKIYDLKSGKTYDCKMNLVGNDLKVRGYVGISLFGRTEVFQRIK